MNLRIFLTLLSLGIGAASTYASLVTGEVFLNGGSVESGNAGDSSIIFASNTLTDAATGVSFRLQFTGTAPIGGIVFPSTDLGIQQASGGDQFDFAGDSITFDSISIFSFNDGGSGLSISAISDVGFIDVSFNAAGVAGDTGTINGNSFSGPGTTPVAIAGAPVGSVTITYSGGSYRLDSLGLSATVTAVPEPAGLSLIGVLLGASGCIRSRYSKRKTSTLP